MSRAPELFAEALARGLVFAGEVLTGRVAVTDRSRSNVVHRIDLDGRPLAFIKWPGAAAVLDGEDPVGAERRVLTAVAGVEVVPQLVADGRGGGGDALWTGAVDGIPLYAVHGTPAHVLAVARAWGVALAKLHRAVPAEVLSERGVGPIERPWVLDPDRLPASMGVPSAGSALAALLDESRSAPLRAVAAHVGDRWSPDVLLHGDQAAANVIVAGGDESRDGADGEPMVRFVDFEGAGLGPATWDLACALDTLGGLVRQWGRPEVVSAFVTGYRVEGGPARVDPAHLAIRALVTGWQATAGLLVAGDSGGAWSEARVHLDRARHWASVWAQRATPADVESGPADVERQRGAA